MSKFDEEENPIYDDSMDPISPHFDPRPWTGIKVKVSRLPDCDICLILDRKKVPAVVDAKTKKGPWVNMCQTHFDAYGLGFDAYGLGLGLGLKQREES